MIAHVVATLNLYQELLEVIQTQNECTKFQDQRI